MFIHYNRIALAVELRILISSFNPYMTNRLTNGLSHHYHVGQSTVIFRCIRSDSEFFFFSMKLFLVNRIATDGTPCSVASHLGLCRLPMSRKKVLGLYD